MLAVTPTYDLGASRGDIRRRARALAPAYPLADAVADAVLSTNLRLLPQMLRRVPMTATPRRTPITG